MTLVRWEPFREIESWRGLESLQRRMNRLFEGFLPEETELGWSVPAAEMEETDTEIHLKLEVPGLEAKDINIEATADAIAISGERKSEKKTEEKGVTRSEFYYGKFERTIPLPTAIQTDKVRAEYTNGILNLTLPKAEEEKHKVVKVNVG